MQTIKTIESVRDVVAQARKEGKAIGLVPTMGALHAGHVSLIAAAVDECDFVVVSIFVNPTQFGPCEDLDKYPRDLDSDVDICRLAGADIIFAPTVEEMYPEKIVTWVTVEGLTEYLCAKSRPGHFRGVTTVCSKLFNVVCPDIAFFGQKDAQQVIVIKRMIKDINMPLKIKICPTVREKDGLAISSRNQYLNATERKDAVLLYKALTKCKEMVSQGCCECDKIIDAMQQVLNSSALIEIEYVNIVDPQTLQDVEVIGDKGLVAVAVKLGTTRLIDNIFVNLNKL